MAAPTSGWTSRSRPSAASGDVRPVAGGAIVAAGVDRHPKVWPSHIEDRRVAPGAASARRTGRTLPDAALVDRRGVVDRQRLDGDVAAAEVALVRRRVAGVAGVARVVGLGAVVEDVVAGVVGVGGEIGRAHV